MYIKDLFKMNTVYDCARPFILVAGIVGIGGNTICEIDGVRSVRNNRISSLIAAVITLILTPAFFIWFVYMLLFAREQRPLVESTAMIITFYQYTFIIFPTAVTCIRTHACCKNLAKFLQILNDTDMMLKRENIRVIYWRIVLKTIIFGLISCNYNALTAAVYYISTIVINRVDNGMLIVKIVIDIACDSYFMFIMLFLLIIRERFVGVNKLLLQNAQAPSIMRDDSLLRRISLARDIHEQLSEAIALFSDISRFLIIGVLVPGTLKSIYNALTVLLYWDRKILTGKDNHTLEYHLVATSYIVVVPIIKTVILAAICEAHKNNRGVLNARLRHLISREEDPAIVHQLKQYIWYIYDTAPGLIDFQLIEIDFTLLFMASI